MHGPVGVLGYHDESKLRGALPPLVYSMVEKNSIKFGLKLCKQNQL